MRGLPSTEGTTIEPFLIDVPAETLHDLSRRLRNSRWPDEVTDAGWDYGTNLDYLRELCTYWVTDFDWRARERELNRLPQFRATIDGQRIHFVHVRGNGPDPLPLVLTHGWPSSFVELVKLIPRLTDPQSFGGDRRDAFDVVVPSLPGYGFSDRPRDRLASERTPELWEKLMAALGYTRYGVHGGDIGAGVSTKLAQRHPTGVVGLHLLSVGGSIDPATDKPTEAELAFLAQSERWLQAEGAYGRLQRTKPQSLAYGLNDSPAGLAAWIVEKLRSWSDCEGDVERAFSKDELLTNITIYWVTETIAASFRPYWDNEHAPGAAPPSVQVPTGFAIFPRDLTTPPREFAERFYNVRRWSEMPRGGHFPAHEQPDLLADELRSFFGELR